MSATTLDPKTAPAFSLGFSVTLVPGLFLARRFGRINGGNLVVDATGGAKAP